MQSEVKLYFDFLGPLLDQSANHSGILKDFQNSDVNEGKHRFDLLGLKGYFGRLCVYFVSFLQIARIPVPMEFNSVVIFWDSYIGPFDGHATHSDILLGLRCHQSFTLFGNVGPCDTLCNNSLV